MAQQLRGIIEFGKDEHVRDEVLYVSYCRNRSVNLNCMSSDMHSLRYVMPKQLVVGLYFGVFILV